MLKVMKGATNEILKIRYAKAKPQQRAEMFFACGSISPFYSSLSLVCMSVEIEIVGFLGRGLTAVTLYTKTAVYIARNRQNTIHASIPIYMTYRSDTIYFLQRQLKHLIQPASVHV